METEPEFAVTVRYFRLSESLQDYFTVLTQFDFECPVGQTITDRLHPEWTAMRFTVNGHAPNACVGQGDLEPTWPFVATGPTSKSLRFGVYGSKIWGLGLLPAGYARFIDSPASTIADRIVECAADPAFSLFAPVSQIIADGAGGDDDETAARVDEYLLAQKGRTVPHSAQILKCQVALREGTIATVADLADQLNLSGRSLERLCKRYFGFPPKKLLRRQRFLRSLAQFTVAPENGWIHALDSQYYDQAHFVRDFKAFMGVTPTQYAAEPHPILDRIMAQRMIDQGAATNTTLATDLPTMLRYIASADGD